MIDREKLAAYNDWQAPGFWETWEGASELERHPHELPSKTFIGIKLLWCKLRRQTAVLDVPQSVFGS